MFCLFKTLFNYYAHRSMPEVQSTIVSIPPQAVVIVDEVPSKLTVMGWPKESIALSYFEIQAGNFLKANIFNVNNDYSIFKLYYYNPI